MSLVLALDTTAHFGSIALARDGEVLEEVLLHSPEGFSQTIFEHLKRLLDRHGIAVGGIDCFAAASGPGSFTGVRVGLSAVKGLAAALGRPVAAVSNLVALAACGTAPLRAAVLDARRGEVYGALYDAALAPVMEERVVKFRSWLDGLPGTDLEFVSTDFSPFRAELASTRFAGAPVTERRALAGVIARLAEGRCLDPALTDANYVRRSDAELFWKES